MIAEAGFDGVSADYTRCDYVNVKRLVKLLAAYGLGAEDKRFPRTVDDLAPVLEIATEFCVHHAKTRQ